MSNVDDSVNVLKEMGFSEEQARIALSRPGCSEVDNAAEWLLSNNTSETNQKDPFDKIPTNNAANIALNEEDRKSQIKRLDELRNIKRGEREEREKREQRDREKKRIEDGKAMSVARDQLETKEMKKIVEQRQRDKLEEKLAKERVKAQIEQDRRDRKAKECQNVATSTTVAATTIISKTISTQPKEYLETKIQIRQLDGKPIVQTFKVKETLAAVRLHVQLTRSDKPGMVPKLMTNFPKKVFSDDDYDTPLEKLGLVPSSSLIISP